MTMSKQTHIPCKPETKLRLLRFGMEIGIYPKPGNRAKGDNKHTFDAILNALMDVREATK
jgi:hypothetical protein